MPTGLAAAGLDIDTAMRILAERSRGDHELIPLERVRAIPMSGTTKRVLDGAVARGAPIGLITRSMLVVAMLEDEQVGGSAPQMIRELVHAAAPADRIQSVLQGWMQFYGKGSPGNDASLSLFELFRYAREIAVRVSGESEIKGRHMVGALLASRDMRRGANELLAKFIDPRELERHFLNYLEVAGARERDPDDMAAWRRLLGVDDPSSVPRYDAEGYTRRDDLGIGTDVDAFAALIASKALQPPMSIGLFGDWGSGKSFFMSQLRDAVADLAGTSDRFHERIVQIDFNAWHYVEANLWASLVENIFRNLRTSRDTPQDPAARTEAVLQRIDASLVERADAEKKVEEAQLARDLAAETFEKKKAEVEKSATKLNLALAQNVWDAVTIDETTRAEFSNALKKASTAPCNRARTYGQPSTKSAGSVAERGCCGSG